MNKLNFYILLLVSLVFISFRGINNTTKKNNEIIIKDDLYELTIKITDDITPLLSIDMDLKEDSYFVSPHAKRDFKGKFLLDFGDYSNIEFDGLIDESPRSQEINDPHPYVQGAINWVRVDTKYIQKLKLKTDTDFEVFGRIKFTIEPRCSLEVIPLGIRYKNGKFSFFEPGC